MRDADELHDALLDADRRAAGRRRGRPGSTSWSRSAARRRYRRRRAFWTCAERLELARTSIRRRRRPGSTRSQRRAAPERDEAVAEIVRGWLESSGPVTVARDSRRASRSMQRDDRGGAAAPRNAKAKCCADASASRRRREWCNRRVLARIHRLTLGTLRREIEPVTTARLRAFPAIAGSTSRRASRLHGIDGTLQIIRQLEGYEIPAVAWETQFFPRASPATSPSISTGSATPAT